VLIRREREDHNGERHPGWLRHTLADTERFLREGDALLRWRTLADFGPTALYMGVYAVDLGFILQVLAYHLAWYAIITVYAAMVLVVVLIPIPTEIGVAEIGALGALEAFGVPHHRAALVALALRLLTTGATIVVAGSMFVALRGEITRAEHEAGGHAAACARGAHEAASTTEQDKGRIAN
jgi:uncharacterized membrane protein YbhN (UPF0104 family)